MKRSIRILVSASILLAPVGQLEAQEGDALTRAQASIEADLEAAIDELDGLRRQIEEQKLPLARRLNELDAELVDVRARSQELQRTLDARSQDLFTLEQDVKARQGESDYLADLLSEYIRNLEAGLHITELQLFEQVLASAKDAVENPDVPRSEVFARQAAVVTESIGRLEAAIGGRRFAGRAIDPSGVREDGVFVLLGPAALFRSDSGEDVGTAEQRLGSLQPAVIAFDDPLDTAAAEALVRTGKGEFPFDPTLGDAHKIAATQDTFLEHAMKGGMVMIPIAALAGSALLVALFKWIALSMNRRPSKKQLRKLFDAVAEGNEEEARARVAKLPGPTGRMLAAGVAHLREPVELVEELMYEQLLSARLKLNRFLPFVAIAAASAPLLGLLGTVTGIINTFKLITVFGSGDVKSLSGGISEALITTKFGLIVAIPSLLLHAFLARKARGIANDMEMAAVGLVNQLALTPMRGSKGQPVAAPVTHAAPDPALVKAQVSEILGELLGTGEAGAPRA
jgi:biopolymer transport protein ExbB